jgi:hypothetical protein
LFIGENWFWVLGSGFFWFRGSVVLRFREEAEHILLADPAAGAGTLDLAQVELVLCGKPRDNRGDRRGSSLRPCWRRRGNRCGHGPWLSGLRDGLLNQRAGVLILAALAGMREPGDYGSDTDGCALGDQYLGEHAG